MKNKFLRLQLYVLFAVTTLNLIYFYYRDNLPDNFYDISSNNVSINFFSYYFFTVLANFGYWCGIWVTVSFAFFAILFSTLFQKPYEQRYPFIFLALLPMTLCLSYFLLPITIGDGLYSLLVSRLHWAEIFLGMVISSLTFFYLVSPVRFFQLFNYLKKNVVYLFNKLISTDYKSINFKDTLDSLKVYFNKIKTLRFQNIRNDQPSSAIKLHIAESPKIKTQTHELAEVDLIENSTAEDDEYLDETDEDLDTELLTDSTEDSDDLIEEDDEEEEGNSEISSNTFFDSEELINCIATKNSSKHTSDPEEQYFVTIARAIEEKLKQFNISAQVINVLKGPVVDTFELELGSGVKVTGVTNRTDDLSLALMGAPIRMVYPMKGKSTIGIEVPRNPRDVIYLDEVLKSREFNSSNYKLPVAMGKDAYGDAAVIDLAATPHLLVAGTTGAGKSVFINTLLVSLIIKFSPKQLRLILLDPKQLELALFQRLPHLVMPVVTDSQIASVALLWAIDEMERRYSLLKDFGVKNIEGFNKKIKTVGTELTCKINKYYPDAESQDFELPFIVVVVDEFADLMLSKSGKAIETSISRLAAKARASGIHIVLATQRPSTDIITGVIKANFPTRVSFRVFTNIDSRVILDGMGAEKLLGKGDMLFKQGIDVLRMHSAYVHEDEIEALVDKLASLPINYDTGAMEFIQSNGTVDEDVEGITTDGEGNGLKDEKFQEAVRCVASHRVASASFLQRRLGVGYNRAANLIEEMERQGVVGPAQGSKPRKVLIPPPNDLTP
jgi:S-DNA-T family DNA segregation ATPase FtsK/SpoIIIE